LEQSMTAAQERRFVDGVMDDAGRASDVRGFRRCLVERLRAFIGLDTAAIAPADPSRGEDDPRSVCVDAPLFDYYLRNQRRFHASLLPTMRAMVSDGAVLSNDVYSAADRQRLDIYVEVINPAHITSAMHCALSFRGCPTGAVSLNRHGRSPPFRARELERVRRVLPLVCMADAAVASQAASPGTVALPTLSPREMQVARLVRMGLTNKEIAAVVGTSVDTVRKQTISVYEKLGVSGRVVLVARFGAVLGADK
jgi:DNA-binding CsgD family transcriptional regulator